MNTNKKTARILEDVQIKLSALWATLMFIFVYVDIMGKYEPGHLENAIAGEVGGFPVTQGFLLAGVIGMMIPSLMIFLSLILKAKVNRWANIIVAILQIFVVVGFIGESLIYYIFGSIVEVVLLSLIIWYAWKWPKLDDHTLRGI